MAACSLLGLHWVLASLIAVLSYIIYGRLGLLKRSDIKALTQAVLGEELTSRIYEKTRWIIDYIFT